ncbi:hypothetical protein [Nocardioides jensenii]|uniref:hypothetical protein n=1 Tax=Nocardioides jensenii TaxID=1843 RepID=UPI000833D918|nr:hypothetical protein [Nocardioides jensenii]
MKKTLIALAVAATAAVLIQSPATSAPATASGAPTKVATAAQTAAPWQLVSTASDVDGNGQVDYISLRKVSATICAVKVATDSGRVATKSLYSSMGNPCVWHGSAPLDPVSGAEISVVTGWGAHTAWHSVLTWRAGRIVLERAPSRARWTVDGTAMLSEGLRRTRNASGQIRLVHTAVFRGNRGRWDGQAETYAYRSGTWVVSARKHVRLTTTQAGRVWGWHVRGLPRWPAA